MGIYESDIDEFINNIEKVIPENEYFNLHILNTDFESKLYSEYAILELSDIINNPLFKSLVEDKTQYRPKI